MKKLFTILLLISISISCQKLEFNEDTVFTIKEGDHYSVKKYTKTSAVIRGIAYFHHSCIYDLNSNDQGDWNKLIGITYNVPTLDNLIALENEIHQNSARIGWRWNIEDSKFDLGYYVYIEEEIYKGTLDQVAPYKTFNFYITSLSNAWLIQINDQIKVIEKNTNEDKYNILYPYFGGNKTAPHNMEIAITFIN